MAINTIGNTGNSAPPPAAPQGGGQAPAARAPVAAPVPQQPTPDQVQQAVKSIEEMIQNTAPNSLQFSIDDATGKTVVSVTDTETGEMIRQIPSKELLEIARSLDRMQGMLFKQKA